MECVTVIVKACLGEMATEITRCWLPIIWDEIGYVVHYNKNMDDLDTRFKNLRDMRDTIKEKVNTAENRGVVSDRLKEVDKMVGDLEKILEDRQGIKPWLHVCSMYRLSKDGKKLLSDLSLLLFWFDTDFEYFESRESVRKQIIEVLKDDKINRIGIHGMPGTGKTTMVDEIANQARREKLFDEVTKVVFSQNPDLEIVQKALGACLKLEFARDTDKDGRKKKLWETFTSGKKKILVIIDDIWNDHISLEEIGIPRVKGCKVLLTSREERVWTDMDIEKKFKIDLLNENEAWVLFQKKVGYVIEPSHEVYSVAKQVCEECGRLPLAILVVGAALRNLESMHRWNDALTQLKNCKGENIPGVDKKLYSRIKWSFEYLKRTDVMSYSCLLHCSLFPEDAEIPIDDLVMYGVGTRFLKHHNSNTMRTARNRTHVLVDTLKKSHLLLEGIRKDFVKMHDVIRDVAIRIASEEGFLSKTNVPDWPERDEYKSCMVISLRSEQICELPCELQCAELHTLVLECNTHSKPPVSDNFFKGMEKLKVLDLRYVRLPSSPLNLINLRMLRLYDCELQNLTFLKELRKLEMLSIGDSNLKELAVEVGQLTNLRWLDLRECEKLKIIPSGVIKSLSKIEELYFPHDLGEWGVEGNARLDELNSLTGLTTLQIHIGDGMLLPNELCFNSLKRFKISVGRTKGFKYDEDALGAGMLNLDGINLRKECNILMEKAEVLLLTRVEGVKNVLHYGDGKGFLDLKYLQIEDCSDMKYLLGRPKWNVQTQGSFCKLSVLIVEDCTLKFLLYPSTARALPQLQKLDISGCGIMEEIILDDDEEVMNKVIFPQLKEMELRNLPNLRSICGANRKKTSSTEYNISDLTQAFFNEKVSFPALEVLKVGRLENITAIWNDQLFLGSEAEEESSFHQLRNIGIDDCENLVNVIIAGQTGKGEEEITSDEIIVFPRLKNMKLRALSKLKSFYGSKKAAVENDNISQALFNSMVSFPALEKLNIQKLESITRIWDNQLFLGLEAKEESSFQRLRGIEIEGCQKLVNVIPSNLIPRLQNLETVEIRKCESVVSIVEVMDEEIIVFPQLKKMDLSGLSNLKSFCGSKKEAMENDNIPQLQSLFNYKVSFPALEELKIEELESITCTWDNQLFLGLEAKEESSFQQLRGIEIEGCQKLVNVIPSNLIPRLQNLETVKIQRCGSVVSIVEVLNIEKGSATTMELPKLMPVGLNRPIPNIGAYSNLTGEGKDEVMDEEIIVFPQLKEMNLTRLPNLRSFFGSKKEAMENDNIPQLQSFFNSKVKFPCLEKFEYICNKNNVKEIWNNTMPTDAVCKLRVLNVSLCDKLLSVAPSKLLGSFQNLEVLIIEGCPSLEEVFKVEGGSNAEEGMDARDTDIEKDLEDNLVFPQLKSVYFCRLPQLRIFYRRSRIYELPSLKYMTITRCPKLEMFPCQYQNTVTAPLQPFSKEKVAFPVLEELRLSDGSIIFEDIWYGRVPAGSFSKVRELWLDNCHVLEDIYTLLLQRFEVVEELKVLDCYSLQVVFNLEGLEDIKRGAAVFSQITKLDPYHNLTSLSVERCYNLKYLFSLSIARNLTNIENLFVGWCNAIEEIIKNEDQGEEDGAMDEIVFPKLQSMELLDLPNLTSFCWANNAFKLPSLQYVELKKCDNMQTFTSGQISTPVITLQNDDYEDEEVSDLNNYVQQRVQERKEDDDEEDDEETEDDEEEDDEETEDDEEKESGNHDEEKESGNHDEEDILPLTKKRK